MRLRVLVLGVGLALCTTAFLGGRYLRCRYEHPGLGYCPGTMQVVVVTRDLPAGHRLVPDDLLEVDRSEALLRGLLISVPVVTAADQAVGARLQWDVAQGKLIPLSALGIHAELAVSQATPSPGAAP